MTRNADQCSSHWSQVLDPAINHCDWTPTEDAQLLHEVLTHGTNWATIATTHAPKRTTLGLKNRYSTLRLWNQNHSKNMSLQDQHQHMETKSNEGETITVLPTPGRSRADDQEDEDYYDDDDDDDDGEDDDEYDGEGGTDSGATENGEVLGPPDRTRTGGSDHGQHASVSGAAVALNLKEIYDDRYDRQHLHRSSGEVALQTSPTPTLLQPQPSQLTPSPSSAASSSGGSASMTTDSTCMTAGTSTTTINAGMPVSSSGTWTPNSASMLSFDYPPPPPQPLELGGLPRDYAQFYNDMMESIPQSSHSCRRSQSHPHHHIPPKHFILTAVPRKSRHSPRHDGHGHGTIVEIHRPSVPLFTSRGSILHTPPHRPLPTAMHMHRKQQQPQPRHHWTLHHQRAAAAADQDSRTPTHYILPSDARYRLQGGTDRGYYDQHREGGRGDGVDEDCCETCMMTRVLCIFILTAES